MSVNLVELRKFQQLWGPVLQTIPAVVEMVERKDDLDRAIAAAKHEYETVKANIDTEIELATTRLDEAALKLTELETQRGAIKAEIEAAKQAAAEAAAVAEKQKQEKLAVVTARIAEASKQLAGIDKEAAAKLAVAREVHSGAVAQMTAEIEALEAKKSDVQSALDSLKARLG